MTYATIAVLIVVVLWVISRMNSGESIYSTRVAVRTDIYYLELGLTKAKAELGRSSAEARATAQPYIDEVQTIVDELSDIDVDNSTSKAQLDAMRSRIWTAQQGLIVIGRIICAHIDDPDERKDQDCD